MSSYLSSNDIYMFPVATRGADYPLARLTTEQNMVNIIKSLTDSENGFVITPSGNIPVNAGEVIEFIIGGYYVKADLDSLIALEKSADSTLYAKIVLDPVGTNISDTNQELISQASTSTVGTEVTLQSVVDMNQVNAQSSMDIGTEFTGISFEWRTTSNSPTSTTTETYLPILYHDETTYSVKEEYRYKLKSVSVNTPWIDLTANT